MAVPVTDDESIDHFAPEIEVRSAMAGAAQHAKRLDHMLVGMAPEFSRSYLQKLVSDGAVKVNGVVAAKAAAKLQAGMAVEVELRPTPDTLAFRPEPVPLDIVYEDEHLLVVNKPAGLVVHPAAGNWSGTLLNGLLAYDARAAHLPRAGIVHRLDKDTSGLMLVGRTLQACTELARMIAAREVSRKYLALACGEWGAEFKAQPCTVEAPIGRDARSRLKMVVVEQGQGKAARTDVTFLDGNEKTSLLECRLHTGRTHQIRVHMAYIGYPLVGDVLYGGPVLYNIRRQALHAYKLSLLHPVGKQELFFEQKCPQDFILAVKIARLASSL